MVAPMGMSTEILSLGFTVPFCSRVMISPLSLVKFTINPDKVKDEEFVIEIFPTTADGSSFLSSLQDDAVNEKAMMRSRPKSFKVCFIDTLESHEKLLDKSGFKLQLFVQRVFAM